MQEKPQIVDQSCDNTPELIRQAGEIGYRYAIGDIETPVNPFRSPEELEAALDLDLSEAGEPIDRVMEAIEQLIAATPRSTSNRFYNQLFGGRDPIATAAAMLAPVVNTSLYTFKAAGPMAIIEQIVIARMAQALGMPSKGPEGVFTPGGSISNLIAMIIARNEACPDLRNEGSNGERIMSYVSQDCHYSISKNAGILGMGRKNVRKIPTDSVGRLRPELMREAIEEDRANGLLPGIIIATSGTTVLGAFDPIEPMAQIARDFGIWFHVDASYGGSIAMSPAHRHLVAGIDQADSVAWNPHKAMGVPLSAAAFITRESGSLRRSLDETADYLFQADDDRYNPGTRSIQCGRRNDALKVWAAWKHHGDDGYRDRMDRLMTITEHVTETIRTRDEFVLSSEPEFINVCFEVVGKCSRDICDLLRERNELLVGHAVVNGRRIIRVPFVNGGLTTQDADEMLELILDAASSLPAGDNAV